MKYVVVISKMGNNYGAYSPDVDGCVATGETPEKCLQNMKEALNAHLEDEPLPSAKGIDYWLEQFEEIAHAGSILIEVSVGQEIFGTKEAFQALVAQRGIYKTLNVDKSTVANWRKYLQNGQYLTTDKMEEMLKKGGWVQTSQPSWVAAR